MSGKTSRTKGATFERDLAKRWRDNALYPDARRGIGQSRAGGEVPDVDGTPYWVEAKHRRVVNVRAALKRAEENTDGRPAVAVVRYHGDGEDKAIVCMRLEDWERLARARRELEKRFIFDGGHLYERLAGASDA